jgi:hypothetical protein
MGGTHNTHGKRNNCCERLMDLETLMMKSGNRWQRIKMQSKERGVEEV